MINMKFYGLGGQGVVTAAKILSEAVSLFERQYAITVPAYGHERRGAPVNTSIIVDAKPVLQNCFVYRPDLVLVMDPSVKNKGIDVAQGISEEAVLVLNTADEQVAEEFKNMGFQKVYFADGSKIALEEIGVNIPNGSMLGVLAKSGVVSIDSVESAIKDAFGPKNGGKNARAARRAYEETQSK